MVGKPLPHTESHTPTLACPNTSVIFQGVTPLQDTSLAEPAIGDTTPQDSQCNSQPSVIFTVLRDASASLFPETGIWEFPTYRKLNEWVKSPVPTHWVPGTTS